MTEVKKKIMDGYQLNRYGRKIVQNNVDLVNGTLVNVKVASKIVKWGRFAYTEEEGRNIDNCDRAIIVALPMEPGEKAKILEINDTTKYATESIGGKKQRLYDPKQMTVLKEITHAGINKKLYENNFSKYKK